MHGFSLAVLAGGRSQRFGSNKALAEIRGQTILARVLAAGRGLADEVFVVTNTPEAYPDLGLPLVPDVRAGGGSLRGLHTALASAHNTWVLCLACDMPFVRPQLLAHLCEQAQGTPARLGGVVPRHAEGHEPFCAVYHRERCLPHLDALLDADIYKVIALYERVAMAFVDEPELRRHDPELVSFFNVNTPADLVTAATLAERLDG